VRNSSEPNISVGLDIGNTKITTTIGKVDNSIVDIIGVGKSKNQGIRKGVIVDIDETVSAISASLEEAERMAGVQIQQAIVGISGPFIECEQSHGVIAVASQDGIISEEDVIRVLEAAKAIPSKPNREFLHVLPINFIIDGSESVKDPIGMSGIRLEVVANIITASTNAMKSIAKAVEQSGISAAEMVFSPLATAKALLTKRQIDIGVLLIDIGASTSSYAVFEEGELITCGVVPVGSMHITNDIAIGLRTNLDLAESIKCNYGYALPDKVDNKEELDLSRLDKTEEGSANLKYISEIIEARLNEIFSIIKDNMTMSGTNEALPAGVVITGGGAKIEGIVEMTKDIMRLPASIGKPAMEITGLIDKLDDPIYSTSIGLMIWGREGRASGRPIGIDLPNINNVVTKVKSVFKNLLP
jgi:cell division protein FtsA